MNKPARPFAAMITVEGGALSLALRMHKSIPETVRKAIREAGETAAEDLRGRILLAAAASTAVPWEDPMVPRDIGASSALEACLELAALNFESADETDGYAAENPSDEAKAIYGRLAERTRRAAQAYTHLGVALGMMGLGDDALEGETDGGVTPGCECPVCQARRRDAEGEEAESPFSLSSLLKGVDWSKMGPAGMRASAGPALFGLDMGPLAGRTGITRKEAEDILAGNGPRPTLFPKGAPPFVGAIIAAAIAKAVKERAGKGDPKPATGGPVAGGKTYTVGETGPESIIPKGDARYGAGEAEFPAGGVIHMAVDLSVASQEEVDRVAPDMDRAMDKAVKLTDPSWVDRLYTAARDFIRAPGLSQEARKAYEALDALVDEVEGEEDPFAPPPPTDD